MLLVFNQLREDIEIKAKIVGERYGVRIEPVYLNYLEFKRKFFNYSDRFMKNLKNNRILILGIEYWVELENEKA